MEVGPGERVVLLGPDSIARVAARAVRPREHRWFLRLPRRVRRSFVEEVVDGGGTQDRWLLLQNDEVRESYVREVLEFPLDN